jgi:hypothetical protein
MKLVNDTTTQWESFFTVPVPSAVPTTADDDSVATERLRESTRKAWDSVIDTLLMWMGNPSSIEDEGIDPPDSECIANALRMASTLKIGLAPPPTRVVPSPDGEVVFEREDGNVFESMTFAADQSREYRLFEGTRLVQQIRGR